jgi:hypothetical protein
MEEKCSGTPKSKNVKEFFKSRYFWKPFLGIIIGGLGGFLYFYFVGCNSGSCPITGSAYGSIITGSVFGLFITSSPCSTCK